MDKIFGGWEWAGYDEPSYEVAYCPDRTTLILPLVSADSTGQERSKTIEDGLTDAQIAIVNYLRNEGPSRTSEIAVGIEKSVARTNVILRQLVESGIVTVTGATSARRYRLAE